MSDPVETVIALALNEAGIGYQTDAPINGSSLDFYLYNSGVYIECKRMFTKRILRQMQSCDEIIVIQGLDAAKMFASMIAAKPKE